MKRSGFGHMVKTTCGEYKINMNKVLVLLLIFIMSAPLNAEFPDFDDRTTLSLFLATLGTIGTVSTVITATEKYEDTNGEIKRVGWRGMHTVTMTISVSSIVTSVILIKKRLKRQF